MADYQGKIETLAFSTLMAGAVGRSYLTASQLYIRIKEN